MSFAGSHSSPQPMNGDVSQSSDSKCLLGTDSLLCDLIQTVFLLLTPQLHPAALTFSPELIHVAHYYLTPLFGF